MVYQLKRKQQLNCDLAKAWQFFSSAHNLADITPRDMNFVILSDLPEGEIYEGMLINYTVSPLLGIPLKWQTKITQVDFQKSFTDFQQKGPFKLWRHQHVFIPNADGVLMSDTVDYELPFGIIGTLAHRLIVQQKVEDIFNHRFKVLEQLFNQQNN